MLERIYNFIKWSKKTNNEEYWGWLIGVWEKETDYLLWGDDELLKRIKKMERPSWQVKYEYNQWAQYETRNYCTIYSALTELSYLFGYKFTLCQIKEIGNRMIKDKKLNPNKGAYLSDAIDYTRKWWNENFPETPVSSYRFSYLDTSIWDYNTYTFNKKYRFLWLTQIWYRTSSELYKELQSDKWYASKKNYPKVGGHAVSTYWLNIIDNYKGKNKNNRYSFKHPNDLIKNGVIFEHWYIFIKD